MSDSDVALLATIAGTLQADYAGTAADPWEGSPFAWIRSQASRRRGKIGEQLIAGWCAARNLDVNRSPDSEADRLIEGVRVEIKFSTEWENGIFKFQQIRDQDYIHGICLGSSPFDASCWVVPKAVLRSKTPGQHGGAEGEDTHWLSFPVDAPPTWLEPYGGTLAKAYGILKAFRKTLSRWSARRGRSSPCPAASGTSATSAQDSHE